MDDLGKHLVAKWVQLATEKLGVGDAQGFVADRVIARNGLWIETEELEDRDELRKAFELLVAERWELAAFAM
jgi:hypothetical protein